MCSVVLARCRRIQTPTGNILKSSVRVLKPDLFWLPRKVPKLQKPQAHGPLVSSFHMSHIKVVILPLKKISPRSFPMGPLYLVPLVSA